MSLFNFVKEAGEKLLGLDDEEPEGPQSPRLWRSSRLERTPRQRRST
jgi:hypothetical protein